MIGPRINLIIISLFCMCVCVHVEQKSHAQHSQMNLELLKKKPSFSCLRLPDEKLKFIINSI